MPTQGTVLDSRGNLIKIDKETGVTKTGSVEDSGTSAPAALSDKTIPQDEDVVNKQEKGSLDIRFSAEETDEEPDNGLGVNGPGLGRAEQGSRDFDAMTAQKKQAMEETEPKTKNNYQGVDLSKDSFVYDYDFLTGQPPMHEVVLPEVPDIRDNRGKIDRSKVISKGLNNARKIGTVQDGKIAVTNRYSGRTLRVDTESIRHSLNGDLNRILTNGRLASVIGDVLYNAIPINALYDTAKGVNGTYAMAGYATDSLGREFVAIITVEQVKTAG